MASMRDLSQQILGQTLMNKSTQDYRMTPGGPVREESGDWMSDFYDWNQGWAEAGRTIGSGLLGSIPAGWAGLGELAMTGDPAAAARRVQDVQQALTYVPRSEQGMQALSDTGAVLAPLAAPAQAIGQTTLDITGSPAAATAAEIGLDPLNYIPGVKGLAAMAPLIKRAGKGKPTPPGTGIAETAEMVDIGQPPTTLMTGDEVFNAPVSRTAAPIEAKGHSVPSALLVEGAGQKPTIPVVQSFTPANTSTVFENLDLTRANNPSPLTSENEWLRMEEEAFGGDYLPAAPSQAIQYTQSPDKLIDKLNSLTPELKASVDEGFGYVQDIKNLYNVGLAPEELTGRLFTWGILSRGAGPVQQEAAFIDILNNSKPFIDKAIDGTFTEADLIPWKAMVKESLPPGSPSKQVTMNANAAGKLLLQLSKVPAGSNESGLTRLHNLLADPNATGREFRREFFRLTDKPGIDNKVVSFIGLVSGKDDLLVMDRVQSRHLWDDGRFEGKNIYDGYSGGGLNKILAGPRGLLVTEALEDGLAPVVTQAYEAIGRPNDASLGRMHWETWVAHSDQAVSHSTLRNVRTGSPVGGSVTEGKPGTFTSGTTYRQTINGPIVEYPLSDGGIVRMTPERLKELNKYIKTSKNGIIPPGFLVGKSKNRPWFERLEVNREKLDDAARQFEDARADGSLKSGAPRTVQGGGSLSERRRSFLTNLRREQQRLVAARDGLQGGAVSRNSGKTGIYTRGGEGGTGGVRSLGVDPQTRREFESAGLQAPVFKQAESPVDHRAQMVASLRGNKFAPQVDIKSVDDLANMELFQSGNGAGFAIDNGDVVAVYGSPQSKGSAHAMIQAAIEAGGTKLDAFDTYLPEIYETAGFRPVARIKWDESQKPDGWDKKVFARYNNGEPDVVWFAYDPKYYGEAVDSPYVDSWDEGVSIQSAKVREYQGNPRSVMPAPQRFFDPTDKGFKPFLSDFGQIPGGRYLEMSKAGPKDITGEYPEYANIKVGPDGKPKFSVSEKVLESAPVVKGTLVKTNLFKKKAGWKWTKPPKGYDPNPDSSFPLVSVEAKGKHFYSLETDFPEGVDLARYPKSKSEPRLRPTRKGNVHLGKKVGEISVRGKKHPVYDSITVKAVVPAALVAGGMMSEEEGA